MLPQDYFEDLINNKLSYYTWSIPIHSNPDHEYEKRKFEVSMEVINKQKIVFQEQEDEVLFYESMNKQSTLSDTLNLLIKSLKNDIAECTQNRYNELLDKCHIQMLPIGLCEAFCASHSFEGVKLDGYAIGINEAMYIALQLMTKAILLESLENDLKEYQKSGSESFQYSINLFIKHDPHTASKMLFWDLPAEIHGEISGYQSLISMIILQFIGLHEFGHIVNKDLDIIEINALHVINSSEKYKNTDMSKHHQMEYAADAFALRALNSRSSNNTSIWANFIAIYLFFHWLHYVQIVSEDTSTLTHPEPLDRAKVLVEIMIDEIGDFEQYKHELHKISTLTKKWFDGTI